MSHPPTPVEVFCSYAAADEPLWRELEKHLSLMQRQGLISLWYADQIIAGTDWAATRDAHLESASLILLLISADFLASDYCYGVELQRAMQRHEANTARVIPILLKPVDWQDAPFGRLKALPTNEKPMTTWPNQDEAFADVAAGLRKAIEDLPRLTVNAPLASLPPAEGRRKKGLVSKPEEAGKYRIENQQLVQGQIIGSDNAVHQYYGTPPPSSLKVGAHPLSLLA